MFSENNRISGRQMFRLLSYDLIGLSTLLLPQVLAKIAGTDGVFCLVAGTAAALFYLWLLSFVQKKMEVDFGTFLRNRCGVVIEKIVLFFYALYFFLAAVLVAVFFAQFIADWLLEEKSFGLILALLLLLAGYGVYTGIEGRARVYEFLFWFLLLPLFLMLAGACREVDVDYWTPIGVASWGSFCKGSYVVFLWESLIFLVLFFYPYAAEKKVLIPNARRALLLTGGLNLVLYLILLGVFGSRALAAMEYPAVTLMSLVQIPGGFLKRTDALMVGIWFFTLYALLNGLLFYSAKTAKDVFRRGREGGYLMAVLLLLFAAAFFCYRNEAWRDAISAVVVKIGAPVAAVLPLLAALFPMRSRHGDKMFSSKQAGSRHGAKAFSSKQPGSRHGDKMFSSKQAGSRHGDKMFPSKQPGSGAKSFFSKQAGSRHGDKKFPSKQRGSGAKALAVVLVLTAAGTLCGCNTIEVEDREFPLAVAVEKREDIESLWLNQEEAGNKLVDYNHLKVMILSEELVSDEELFEELLGILASDANVPRNTYVVIAKETKALLELEETYEEKESAGVYLEELLEGNASIEESFYPTIGTLCEEMQNRVETLFLPYLATQEETPYIEKYFVLKRGKAAGEVPTQAAMLSALLQGKLEKETLILENGNSVRITPYRTVEQFDEENGERYLTITVSCEGEVLYEKEVPSGERSNGEAPNESSGAWYEQCLVQYYQKIADNLLEKNVDISNSYKKIGGYKREWYSDYQRNPDAFEEEVSLRIQVDLSLVR